MSAKKSWDIAPSAPKRRPSAPVRTTPARRVEDMRPAAPARRAEPAAPVRVVMPTRREAGRRVDARRTPLRQRRRQAKKRVLTSILIAALVLVVLALVVLWQPFLRVNTVEATGPDAETLKSYVSDALTGTRFLIVPKNSIFFIPDSQIRSKILAAYPDISAVSIKPAGLTTLRVESIGRASVAWWCGTDIGTPADSCYQMDAQGLLFSPVPLDQRYATDSMLSLYAPLSGSGTSPSGSTLATTKSLPELIQFVKAMKSLNADVVSVNIRGDEADLYTRAGTRITYVLGREQQAANLAASAFPSLNLNDGSLLYVDLRFESKVYFKKK